MESIPLLVIFLACTAAALVFNTIMIWAAYRGFAKLTSKTTRTLRDIQTSGATRQWVASLRTASEQVLKATETTKRQISEFEPAFADFHARYGFFLAQVDAKVERVTIDVSDNAARVRDAVAKPAEKFATIATGLQNAFSFLVPKDEEN